MNGGFLPRTVEEMMDVYSVALERKDIPPRERARLASDRAMLRVMLYRAGRLARAQPAARAA